MNKSQIINTLTEKTDCPVKTADKVVRIVFDSIKEALADGDKVEIRGFGSFTLKHYDAYLGRNPRTGESVRVPPKKLPVFRTGKDLRHRVDQSREQGVKLVEGRSKPDND
jgi:integration host factor subunit beta